MAGSNGSVDVAVEPFFLDTPNGRLFMAHHRPRDVSKIRGHVLVVPPFNEEMNRCRSMMTLQAQALAAFGFGTLIIDLHGTGDSDGEYRDARWEIWLSDIVTAQQWLMAQPGGLKAILGIRLGAILASTAHAELGKPDVALVLWQPVLDGKVHLTQFFRVRMAARLDRPDLPKETTASMRQQLASGLTLEVAGYEIHPALAEAIEGASLAGHPLLAGSSALWLENASPEKLEIPLASRNALQTWNAAGAAVDVIAYPGPAFWQVHERVIGATIIEKTGCWLNEKVAGR